MVPRWRLVALALLQATVASAQVQERVEVARVVVDVRVTDGEGRPVRGLEPADFRVRIDGHPARVESVTWLPGSMTPPVALAAGRPTTRSASPMPGRTVVLLFQKDLQISRIDGLMRMLQRAAAFLEGLPPDVRVAILSYDSRLRLWTDFTTDRARLHRIVTHDILTGAPAEPEMAGEGIAARLDPETRQRTATPEAALELIAKALDPLEGAKSLVYVGFGFGRPRAMSPLVGSMNPEYETARRALVAARVTVFSLDITDADRHTLETGMREVAEATGGFYVKTHEFTEPAMVRLAGALEGQYVLMVEPDPLSHKKRRVHGIDVNLIGRRARVEARRFYVE